MAGNFTNVTFQTVDGTTLRGNYYKPPQPNAPAVILTAGLTFLKEHFIDDFAKHFQAAGFAALIYDHRGWGQSGGTPRHETDFFQQADDYSDAITYIQTLAPEVDPKRICVWGAGHAGGVVMPVAAFDSRVKAVVAMVPFISGEADAQNFPSGYLELALEERAKICGPDTAESKQLYVPAFTLPESEAGEFALVKADAVIGVPEATIFHDACIERSSRAGSSWPNAVSLQTLWHIQKWEPTSWIHRIAPRPFLYIVAEHDKFIPVARQRAAFEKAGSPKEWVNIDSEHLETYSGAGFDANIPQQIAFLKKWL
jgi:uncharacterized protein